ncbi:DUF2066 domain-containing protein [Vibrio algicola]|nr:DUF2066 domain-containing protein [Vibrio algicola]
MRYILTSFLCLLAFSSAAYAKTKVDIYHVEVPMTDVKNAKTVAWAQGLKQVLIKASGDTKIINNAVVKKALTDPSDYLAQFESGSMDDTPSMVMDFSPEPVQSLLSQAHAIFWPQLRNNVLVWVIEDQNFERQIGWEQSGLDSIAPLQASSLKAGLPITLPLGDMDDMTHITAPELWGSFDQPLAKASQRYPVDGVLVLKVTRMGDGAQVDWALHDIAPNKIATTQREPVTGSTEGSLQDSINNAIVQVSAYYAKQNKVAVNQASDDSLLGHFNGINSAQNFFTLERMLKGLSSVAAVQVHQIQGDNIVFKIDLLSDVEEFKKEAVNKQQLTQIQAPVASDELTQQDASQESVTQEQSSGNEAAVADGVSADATAINAKQTTPAKEPSSQPTQDDNQLWFDIKE